MSDQFIIVNKFNEYFTNIGPELANQINKSGNKHFKDYLNTKHDSVLTFHEINNMDIVNVIDRLHAKCSSGNNGISTKLLKFTKDALVEPLKLIINQTFVNGTFPDNLKIAKVIPTFKKDKKTLFSNYRPISLLPAFSYSVFDDTKLFIKVSMDLGKDIQQSLLHLK